MIAIDVPRRRGLSAMEKAVAVALVAGLFFGLELLAGASFAYAGLMALFIVVLALAITVGGGIGTLPSALVFFFAFQHVLFSQVVKFALGQRPDERLFVPITTMVAEIVALLGMTAGIGIVRRVRPWGSRPLFARVHDIGPLRQIAIAGALLALARQAIVILSGSAVAEAAGTAVGPIKQLAFIDGVAFSAAVAVAVAESGGKRFVNGLVWILVSPQIAAGLLSGGRGAIAGPLVAMAITAASFGFRFRPKHGLYAALFAYVFFFIISPFGLALRTQARGLSFVENVPVAASVLTDVVLDPMKYQQQDKATTKNVPPEKYPTLYFLRDTDPTSNFLERFSLIKLDDLVIQSTLQEGTIGWTTIKPGFLSILPSSLGFEKSFRSTGNMLAHRVRGIIAENDFVTAITIGTVGDSFSAFGWLGVFLVPLVSMAFLSFVYSLIVDLRLGQNIFATALLFNMAWIFSEAGSSALIFLSTNTLVVTSIALTIVTQAAKLVNFGYLRPRGAASALAEDTAE